MANLTPNLTPPVSASSAPNTPRVLPSASPQPAQSSINRSNSEPPQQSVDQNTTQVAKMAIERLKPISPKYDCRVSYSPASWAWRDC